MRNSIVVDDGCTLVKCIIFLHLYTVLVSSFADDGCTPLEFIIFIYLYISLFISHNTIYLYLTIHPCNPVCVKNSLNAGRRLHQTCQNYKFELLICARF